MAAKAGVLLVLAALISCHALTGNAQQIGGTCHLSDIKVSQEKTGKVVQGQPEYRVTFENLCECPQDYVDVRCNRLPSVEPIDSKQIKVMDELCMLATTLFKGSNISITYAWKTPQDFTVVSATSRCGEGMVRRV
ncbi:hypothetical protein GQ55_8G178500 [Panicum hallii var. hallii]|uniref:Uncharacterized protein n=1 Tax=Panicum hallii var. hallii TaxID=1504633 RepID=A0A2T7CNK9_9POAL|nr:hypothetical protein GQ55_8G178500 [Panicum hallii var. hallii]